MIRAMAVSALFTLIGVPSMAQAPHVLLFAFASPDAAVAWQAVNDVSVACCDEPVGRQTLRPSLF